MVACKPNVRQDAVIPGVARESPAAESIAACDVSSPTIPEPFRNIGEAIRYPGLAYEAQTAPELLWFRGNEWQSASGLLCWQGQQARLQRRPAAILYNLALVYPGFITDRLLRLLAQGTERPGMRKHSDYNDGKWKMGTFIRQAMAAVGLPPDMLLRVPRSVTLNTDCIGFVLTHPVSVTEIPVPPESWQG